jgi:hypothetical protein
MMWCKKCWKFLDSAHSNSEAKTGPKKKVNSKVIKTKEQEAFDDFSNFYIFPHEFLCLASNNIDRLAVIDKISKPNFDLRKVEVG